MNLDSISQELDRLYEFEISEYISRCNELKGSGYKIYRNSSGQHKVVFTGQQSGGSGHTEEVRYGDEKEPKKENILIRAVNSVKRGINTIRNIFRFIRFLYKSQNGGQYNNKNNRYDR